MRLTRLIALLLFCFIPALGQTPLTVSEARSPNLTGEVQDSAGVVIAQAHIWIHEQSGKREFSAATDNSGNFSIHLPDGYYDVMIGSPGFEPFSRSIWFHEGKSIVLKAKLKPDNKNMQQ